jgi:hypothetical protein
VLWGRRQDQSRRSLRQNFFEKPVERCSNVAVKPPRLIVWLRALGELDQMASGEFVVDVVDRGISQQL